MPLVPSPSPPASPALRPTGTSIGARSTGSLPVVSASARPALPTLPGSTGSLPVASSSGPFERPPRRRRCGPKLRCRTRVRIRALMRLTRCAPRARAIFLTLVLFASITLAQFVGAWIAGSLALLIDAASMLVDVLTYMGNLWAECSPGRSVRERELIDLVVSGVSMLALWAITIPSAVHAGSELLRLAHASGDEPSSAFDVDARIILGFAIAGLLIDGCSLAQLWHSRRARAHEVAAPESGEAALRGANEEPSTSVGHLEPSYPASPIDADDVSFAELELADTAAELNLWSALLHVLADLFRSSTTIVEAVLILCFAFDPEHTDAASALIMASMIVLSSVKPTMQWVAAAEQFAFPSGAHGRGGLPGDRAGCCRWHRLFRRARARSPSEGAADAERPWL